MWPGRKTKRALEATVSVAAETRANLRQLADLVIELQSAAEELRKALARMDVEVDKQ